MAYQSTLPHEIILCIARHLDHAPALSSLARLNSTINNLVTPILYHSISLTTASQLSSFYTSITPTSTIQSSAIRNRLALIKHIHVSITARLALDPVVFAECHRNVQRAEYSSLKLDTMSVSASGKRIETFTLKNPEDGIPKLVVGNVYLLTRMAFSMCDTHGAIHLLYKNMETEAMDYSKPGNDSRGFIGRTPAQRYATPAWCRLKSVEFVTVDFPPTWTPLPRTLIPSLSSSRPYNLSTPVGTFPSSSAAIDQAGFRRNPMTFKLDQSVLDDHFESAIAFLALEIFRPPPLDPSSLPSSTKQEDEVWSPVTIAIRCGSDVSREMLRFRAESERVKVVDELGKRVRIVEDLDEPAPDDPREWQEVVMRRSSRVYQSLDPHAQAEARLGRTPH